MKKFFYVALAAAVLAVSFTGCKKKGGNEPEPPVVDDAISVNITEGVYFSDAVASDGWWLIEGQNETYYLVLSNVETDAIPGEYAVADLDAEYSYLVELATEDTISFTAGSVTLTVENEGKKVTAKGSFTGSDSKKYNVNIVYTEPEAKTTVNLEFEEGELDDNYFSSYGIFGVYAGEFETDYVQLYIWAPDGATSIVGSYTEEDLDGQVFGSGIIVNGTQEAIFSADIEVVQNADESYTITAALLCYNNTLYNVTITIPAVVVVPPTGEKVDLTGIAGTYIDDYRDFDGSYVLYIADALNPKIVEIALNLYDEDFAGEFTMDDIDADYSYFWSAATGKKMGIQALSVTATLNGEGTASTYAGYVIANNGIQYNFSAEVDFTALLADDSGAPARKLAAKNLSVKKTAFHKSAKELRLRK